MSDDDKELSSMGDEMIPMGFADHWYAGGCTAVNPATDLPMIDGCIDAMGNPMGVDLHDFDGFSEDFTDSNFDSFNSCDGVSDLAL
jgi:hypothetical protein